MGLPDPVALHAEHFSDYGVCRREKKFPERMSRPLSMAWAGWFSLRPGSND